MKIHKLVNEIKNNKTILSVGPMSKNCIDATVDNSSDKLKLYISSNESIYSLLLEE